MQRVKFKWMAIATLLIASMAFGGDVYIVTKYGKTGGDRWSDQPDH